MNNIDALVKRLEYKDSPCYLEKSRLYKHPGYSHVFRLAQEDCNLQGVYTLKEQTRSSAAGESIIPVVYVCSANSKQDAARIHKLVWNQNVVPFVLVSTPANFRLYRGFKYRSDSKNAKEQAIEVVKTASEVLDKLGDFSAEAIDSGQIWKSRYRDVTPQTRVDRDLLKNLKKLGEQLLDSAPELPRNSAHALIGKYVFLRYLRERNILSDTKLGEWGYKAEDIFSEQATLEKLYVIVDELDRWLNGSIFPIPREGKTAPRPKHLEKVTRTFLGHDPVSGQRHLPFERYSFKHIPIETLSVVYQQFLHAEGGGQEKGAYYTPIHLVNFMLDELDAKRPFKKGMKVFDPACGSGAFLVQCYRRLVERERAANPGKKIEPLELRELLTKHIYGLDIDIDACRVTELSLILTLLDYVKSPDLEIHRSFLPTLRDKNIFFCKKGFFDPHSEWQQAKPQERYDWIVGNPPWKHLKPKNLDNESDRAAFEWMKINKKSPVGGYQIAQAFAWEVKKCIGRQGIVGLLMPATTLVERNNRHFRRQFFSETDTWCVVNFANLRKLIFKGPVGPAAAFFYSMPDQDGKTTQDKILTYAPFAVRQLTVYEAEKVRKSKTWNVIVDSSQIREIPIKEAATGECKPWKIAMWGSVRDKHLLNSVGTRFLSLIDFTKVLGLHMLEGPQLRKRDSDDKTLSEKIEFVEELVGKDRLDTNALKGFRHIFSFPKKALVKIEDRHAYLRVRGGKSPLKVCRPPHIIINAGRRFAVYSSEYIVVPARQIGISGNLSQTELLKALTLYISSDFAFYHQLLTSDSTWGIERDLYNLSDLKRLPIPPIDKLTGKELSKWVELHDKLAESSQNCFKQNQEPLFGKPGDTPGNGKLLRRLNELVYNLLGIDKTGCWLVHDLLHERLKLNDGKIAKEAIQLASKQEMKKYAQVLKRELDNFLDNGTVKDRHSVKVYCSDESALVEVNHTKTPPAGPVSIVKIDTRDQKKFQSLRQRLLREHRQWVYFDRGLRIFEGRKTYIFKLRQRLYWLKSQALIDADELIADKLTVS